MIQFYLYIYNLHVSNVEDQLYTTADVQSGLEFKKVIAPMEACSVRAIGAIKTVVEVKL